MLGRFIAVTAGTLLLGLGVAQAQDFNLDPTYGALKLNSGFLPDPHTVDIQAGGPASATKLGTDCNGYIAQAPDVRLFYTAGDAPLIVSASSDSDTTLVINDPDGNWVCNDDNPVTFDLDPQITFDSPADGQYDIWVGVYNNGDTPDATLSFSEIPAVTTLDYSLDPDHGDTTLVTGFTPDPFSTYVDAGGSVDLPTAVPTTADGSYCAGSANTEPDFRLFYTPGSFPLVIYATSDGDATLAINDPNEGWYCNDDSDGLNPKVVISNPAGGQYDIWVGAYDSGPDPATLYISEVDRGDTTTPPEGTGEMDFSLTPEFGEDTITSGFEPDPYTVALQAGGPVDAQVSTGAECYGYTGAAPDFRFDYTAGDYPLYIGVTSDADTTLIVNDPDGNWVCDDDSGGNLNPSLSFDTPSSGTYDVWVGTFDQGNTTPATLAISELSGPSTDTLNWDLEPTGGSATLSAGFEPDPYTTSFTAGGPVDVYSAIGSNCYGYATSAPSFRLYYTPGSFPLTFSAASDTDTTMAVADPAGNYFCNDDSGDSLDPMVSFDHPDEGQYDVWIGTYGGADGQADVILSISELGVPSDSQQPVSNGNNGNDQPVFVDPLAPSGPNVSGSGPVTANGVDWTQPPVSGELSLAEGFTPDPATLDVQAGGPTDLSTAVTGATCAGHVTVAPSARISYTAGASPLIISVNSDQDTTLMVNDPNGTFFCSDDDGVGLNPSLTFSAPASGQYDIWVGTYSSAGTTVSATLYASETSSQ